MFLYDTDITKQLSERLYLNSEDRKSPSERPCALFTVSAWLYPNPVHCECMVVP